LCCSVRRSCRTAFLIAAAVNPSPDPLTMPILGAACAALVEVAKFVVWSNDRRRARLCRRTEHPDLRSRGPVPLSGEIHAIRRLRVRRLGPRR